MPTTTATTARLRHERGLGAVRALRPPRRSTMVVRDVDRMVLECADEVAGMLGFRPVIHAGWPAEASVSVAVAAAVVEAVDAALLEVHRHGGASSAIVTIELGVDSVEVCAVDNGWNPTDRRVGRLTVDEPSGIEHGVEEYEGYGTCQWWSIPLDVLLGVA